MIVNVQLSTKTAVNRYAKIFAEAKNIAPDAASILSFGCSTGEEIESILLRWPDADVAGVEINQKARDAARARLPQREIHSPETLTGQFDIIFAMSVLCRWPEKRYGILPYEVFEQACATIDRHLAPGGLLVAYNATYDPSLALGYRPIGREEAAGFVTARNRDGSEQGPRRHVFFRKIHKS